MKAILVRPDVEGDLCRVEEDGQHVYMKQLPVDTAWHVDLRLIEDFPEFDKVVQEFSIDSDIGVYRLRYHPGVEPLNIEKLRDIINPDGPLAPWRICRLAIDLGRHLQALHDEAVPQFVIHPERIGRLHGQFVLLPTMAGILPPLAKAISSPPDYWVQFVDPEVLRTRSFCIDLLYSGDVYSLGRLIGTLCQPISTNEQRRSAFELAAASVESPVVGDDAGADKRFKPVHVIADWMRTGGMTAAAAVEKLSSLEQSLSPTVAFHDAVKKRDVDLAKKIQQDLEAAERCGAFGNWTRDLLLMKAELAMICSPPDYARAVLLLEQAESPKVYEADTQHRLGIAYGEFSTLENHVERSLQCFTRAYECYRIELAKELSSGIEKIVEYNVRNKSPEDESKEKLLAYRSRIKTEWQVKIFDSLMDDWAAVLEKLNDHLVVLTKTEDIVVEHRTIRIVLLRTEALLKKERHEFDAWVEISRSFERFPFDQRMYDLALRVAKQIAPTTLMKWMRNYRDRPGYAAPVAIVWEVNGNTADAERCRQRARNWVPPTQN